ncbi:MAG: hypothetical protein ACKO85_13655, partial [Isosphaeraceae bacterium]
VRLKEKIVNELIDNIIPAERMKEVTTIDDPLIMDFIILPKKLDLCMVFCFIAVNQGVDMITLAEIVIPSHFPFIIHEQDRVEMQFMKERIIEMALGYH